MDDSQPTSPLYKLLLAEGRRLRLPKGQVVSGFEEQSKLYLLRSGYIKRYLLTKEGTKGIQVVFGPNDVFPLTPVYNSLYDLRVYSGAEQYYYESMTPIELYAISQETLREAIDENPLIYRDLFLAAGLRLNSYIHRLESMSLRVANKKVIHQLVFLAEVFGKKTDAGLTITASLTHQDLADILNLARETVSHVLGRLQEKGLIKHDKFITVTDIERLRREAR